MSQQVTDLQAAVATLTTNVQAAVANETALKQKLDAAIAENGTLKTQLADAQANQADPADTTAVEAAITTITQQSQTLADATATTSPSN